MGVNTALLRLSCPEKGKGRRHCSQPHLFSAGRIESQNHIAPTVQNFTLSQKARKDGAPGRGRFGRRQQNQESRGRAVVISPQFWRHRAFSISCSANMSSNCPPCRKTARQ